MGKGHGIIAGMLAVIGLSAHAADLQPGMSAPPFTALDQASKNVRLADYLGKSNVVLYFYPKDDTPGCTAEACSLRDGYGDILATGAVVLGVSADDTASHAAFAEKFHLPFPILADPTRAIIDAYGVRMAVLGIAKRVTFIIDKGGIIRHIVREVNTKAHDQQVLALLKTL
jgi:peroxiredoxin Q/BCP